MISTAVILPVEAPTKAPIEAPAHCSPAPTSSADVIVGGQTCPNLQCLAVVRAAVNGAKYMPYL